MRQKLIIISLTLISILSLLYIYSCNKNSECTTCNAEVVQEKMMFLNKEITFNKNLNFQKLGLDFLESNSDLESINNLIKRLGYEKFSEGTNIGIVLFFTSGYKENIVLDRKSVAGCLIYYKKDDRMYTKLIEERSGNPELNKYLSTSSHNVSMDDIFGISYKIFYKPVVKSIYYLYSPNDFNTKIDQTSLLSARVKCLKSNNPLKMVPISGRVCFQCGGEQGTCMSRNGGPLFCGKCPIIKFGSDIEANSISLNFNYSNLTEKLYDFRDNYLANKPKGVDYIADYETFSNRYDFLTPMSLTDIVSSVNIINNDVLPILNKLQTTPNSTDILYNDETKDRILSVLNIADNIFNDVESDLKINSYKLFVTSNCNKTISEVNHAFE